MTKPLNKYRIVIGLECHVRLKTNSKLFSTSPNKFGCLSNKNANIIDFGMPGVLPVLNKKAVYFAVLLGHALNCKIQTKSVFSRKHYFYPDSPKGYQITQFDKPICKEGYLEIENDGKKKLIGISQIHIEEDAGKSIHDKNNPKSYIDLNRAGTPLLEIVSKAEMSSSSEAMYFFKKIHSIVTFLNICDGNMEEGSLRADLNISICGIKDKHFGVRTEIKNLNSIKFLGQAVDFEVNRKIKKIESGGKIIQETRLWDSVLKESRSMRNKEKSYDYRYFPEPDLPPLIIKKSFIDKIKNDLPELPHQKIIRFKSDLGLSEYNAKILIKEKYILNYFEKIISEYNNPKSVANWIINNIIHKIKNIKNDEKHNFLINHIDLAKLISLIDENKITKEIALMIFNELLKSPKMTLKEIMEIKKFNIEEDSKTLKNTLIKILKNNIKEVDKYKSGKKQLIGFFMGKLMKNSEKNINPKKAIIILKDLLR